MDKTIPSDSGIKYAFDSPSNSPENLKQESKKDFKTWLDQFQLAPRTIREYVFVAKRVAELPNLNSETINKWLKKHPRNLNHAAITKYLEYLELNIKIMKIKEKKTAPRIWPVFDVLEKAVQETVFRRKDIEFFFKIMLWTGAREHEVAYLKLGNLDYEHLYIIFHKTKTGEERAIRVPFWLMKELKEYYADKMGFLANDYLIMPKTKNRNNFNKRLYEKLPEYVINKDYVDILRRTHDFRRAVTNIITRKAGILAAKEYRGDRDIRNTMRYIDEETKKQEKEKAFSALGV